MFREPAPANGPLPTSCDLSGRYIPAIDGLRAIAVLSVVLYHVDRHLLPGGFAGVDVFFVISGFVVSLASASIDTTRLSSLLATFYRRRVVRIFPALLVCVAITQLLSVLFIPVLPNRSWDGDWTGVASVLAASNVLLWKNAASYFAAGPDFNPYTHTWSLGVEEQFYTLFPFVGFWFLYSRHGARRVSGGIAIIAALSAASIVAAALTPQTFAFYMVITRFWELGVGVLLYAVLNQREGRFDPSAPAARRLLHASAIAGTTLLATGLMISDPLRFPWPFAVLAVSGTALLIFLAVRGPDKVVSRALAHPAMRHFGRISYSLYLWHWPVVVLMRWTVGLDTAGLKVAAFLLSWALGYASFRLIERPIRQSGFIARRSSMVIIAAGLVAVGAVAAGIAGSIAVRPHLAQTVTRDRNVWSMVYQSAGPDGCAAHGAGQDGAVVFLPPDCGARAIGRTLFIVGDSHAMAYQRLSGNLARQDGIAVRNFGETGCAVLPRPSADGQSAPCARFVARSLDAVMAQARSGDWVFLPGLRMPRYREPWGEHPDHAYPRTAYGEAELRAFAARVRPLLDRGVAVILEAPKPIYTIAPLRCADWFNRANGFCREAAPTAAELRARGAIVTEAWARLRAIEPRVQVWNPFPLLCPGAVCEPFIAGRPVTYDGDHLSAWAQDRITPDFTRFLLGSSRPEPAGPPIIPAH